jgi:uncharacterized protein (DUF1015 family)
VTSGPIVRAFAGLRYRREDLSSVLAPPYDVISPEQQERLHRRDPHNVVRLELGYGDAGGDDRYARSAQTLDLWRQEGILGYDDGPCLYPCEHGFKLRGRTQARVGVLCAVRLTPFSEGQVLPHEGTLKAPREDRRRLMLACRAQISPVFALHDDPGGRMAGLLSEMMTDEPVAEAEIDSERHRLWRREHDELTDQYCNALGTGPLYIADGHHRYETALAVRDELKQAHPDVPSDAAFNYVLALLCPAEQPGVVILPTHRLVRFPGDDERAGFARFLARHFDRRPIPCALDNVAEAARSLIDMLDEADATGRFGMYTRSEGCSLLSIRPDFLPSEPGPGGVNELGTVLIHRLLIDPALGGDGLAEGVSYVMDETEAVRRVDEGMAECALFLRPTTVEQVKRVAAAGLRMPGKSTYFYPKAPTGLVINDVSPGRAMG